MFVYTSNDHWGSREGGRGERKRVETRLYSPNSSNYGTNKEIIGSISLVLISHDSWKGKQTWFLPWVPPKINYCKTHKRWFNVGSCHAPSHDHEENLMLLDYGWVCVCVCVCHYVCLFACACFYTPKDDIKCHVLSLYASVHLAVVALHDQW